MRRLRIVLARFVPFLRRKPTTTRAGINSQIGVAVSNRKRSLFRDLRRGADLETSVNRFLSDLTTDLANIVRRVERDAPYRSREIPSNPRTMIVQEGKAIPIEPALTSKRRRR